MKSIALLSAALVLGLTLVTGDAEAARRLAGGSSSGMQRESISPQKSPAATPAPSQAAAPTAAKPQAAPGAAQAQPKRSWMGPLAGLAAGLGLAALASHLGFGEELASMLMIGLLVMAVMVVIGMVMRRKATAQQSAMGGGMQYAGALLRPHGPALKPMMEMGLPVADIFRAAHKAGRQLIEEGKISAGLLKTIGRELLPRDMYVEQANDFFRKALKNR